LAQASVNFTANTRLPMVAGWDHLLPAWFTKLSAKYRTPVNSIIFVGAMMLAMGLAGILGVGEQEAYQLLQNAGGSFYAITYMVMFAIPIIGLRGVKPRPPLWLKMAAGSGFLTTLLYVVVSVFPIVQVKSQASFTAKVSGVIIAANIVGAAIFLLAEKRRKSRRADAAITAAD
jgi:amino acid transporter